MLTIATQEMRQGPSLSLEPAWRPASISDPVFSTSLELQARVQPYPAVYLGAEDLSSGPQACAQALHPECGFSKRVQTARGGQGRQGGQHEKTRSEQGIMTHLDEKAGTSALGGFTALAKNF